MSGKLRMYNVEFGDAFLLYGQKENLLVDLGSIQETFNFDPIRDSIRSECVDGQLSLLLTHFHRDHWSGLQNQPAGHCLPHLKMVYLPDIFQMRIFRELDVVVRSLLSDFLDTVILRQKPQFSLADLLREVLPGLPKERICFLGRGDTFQVGGNTYEVLWPRLTREDVVVKRDGPLRDFLNRVDAKLIAAGSTVRLSETMEAMADVLLRDFASLVEHPYATVIHTEQRTYEELYRQAQRLSEILEKDLQWDDGEFRGKVRHYAKQLGGDWNRVSLVFQEKAPNRMEKVNHDGVLMTGDIPKSILTKLSKGSFGAPSLQESYAVIKVPHHGTKSHFSAILPYSRYFCISNGDGNCGYKKITEQYEYVYGYFGKKADIRCTNPRCDFLDWKGFCPYFDKNAQGRSYIISW